MAEEYYKIAKEDAQNVYKSWIDENGIHRVIEAVNEQKDGSLLISKEFVDVLKDDKEYKKIDWTKQAKITKEQVDSKDKIIDEPIDDGKGDDIKIK